MRPLPKGWWSGPGWWLAFMCKLGVPTSVCGSGIKAQFHIDYSKTSFYLQGETLNRTNYIFYIFILRCSTVWFVFSGDVLPLLIHSPPASYSCYSEHIAPLGASPPPPPVPALPLCSIHPEIPPLPFVAMVTNVGDSPALWVKRFGRLLSPFDGGCQRAD